MYYTFQFTYLAEGYMISYLKPTRSCPQYSKAKRGPPAYCTSMVRINDNESHNVARDGSPI